MITDRNGVVDTAVGWVTPGPLGAVRLSRRHNGCHPWWAVYRSLETA